MQVTWVRALSPPVLADMRSLDNISSIRYLRQEKRGCVYFGMAQQ
jgi:hypothetical protein